MTIKQSFLTALSCMTALSMLAACSSESSSASAVSSAASSESIASSEHTHAAVSGWDRNAAEHWQLCECGEKFQTGEHTLGEDMICTECGSEVWLYEDGSADVYNYNEIDEWTRATNFDADGNLVDDMCWEYEYNDHGSTTKINCYYNGMLTDVSEFIFATDGTTMISSLASTYYEDGTYVIAEYNENNEYVLFRQFDENDAETYRTEFEYAQDENGNRYLLRENQFTEGVLTLILEYNQYGDDVLFRELDETGTVVTEMINEYTYSDEGHKEYSKFSVNDVLVQESFFTFLEDDFGGSSVETRIIYYNDDGTYEETFYDEENDYNEPIRFVNYNADGTVLQELNFEFEFDQEMNKLSEKVYSNGVLLQENKYTIFETETEWVHYCSSMTIYNEDGTKSVSEFDQNEDLLSETLYDANGNVIQ